MNGGSLKRFQTGIPIGGPLGSVLRTVLGASPSAVRVPAMSWRWLRVTAESLRRPIWEDLCVERFP
jgi:hypothetical protein